MGKVHLEKETDWDKMTKKLDVKIRKKFFLKRKK
jgi:hypothetical protein